MIQITLRPDDPLAKLIEARASYSGKAVQEVAEALIHDGLIALVHTLHEQFLAGEISQGRMAEQLGITRLDLIHLLEDLGLQSTNL